MVFFQIILATFAISLLSLCGAFLLTKAPKLLEKLIFNLVGLSTGTLLGGAFFHLIPESLEGTDSVEVFSVVLFSFGLFFVIEKILHWHHCHEGDCDKHSLGHMNLMGDLIHNFIDGLIIAGAFLVDTRLGVVTTVALAFHEIPQELGDFGVLLYSGFEKKKALFLNFLVSLSSVLGGIVGFFLLEKSSYLLQLLTPFAAGTFIYISATDLIPELKNEKNLKKSLVSFSLFVAGVFLMYFVKD